MTRRGSYTGRSISDLRLFFPWLNFLFSICVNLVYYLKDDDEETHIQSRVFSVCSRLVSPLKLHHPKKRKIRLPLWSSWTKELQTTSFGCSLIDTCLLIRVPNLLFFFPFFLSIIHLLSFGGHNTLSWTCSLHHLHCCDSRESSSSLWHYSSNSWWYRSLDSLVQRWCPHSHLYNGFKKR